MSCEYDIVASVDYYKWPLFYKIIKMNCFYYLFDLLLLPEHKFFLTFYIMRNYTRPAMCIDILTILSIKGKIFICKHCLFTLFKFLKNLTSEIYIVVHCRKFGDFIRKLFHG